MNRAQSATLAFALLAAAVTVGTAFVAYEGMRNAFERESSRRLTQLAELGASQLSAADLADARRTGPEGTGLLALQVQLDALSAATGLANAAVLDRDGRTLYDVRAGLAEPGARSVYDSLAHATLARAQAGRSVVLPPIRHAGHESRAAAAPVRSEPGTVLVTEAMPLWGDELARLRRDLLLIAAVSVLAVAALAALVLRATASQLALERQLSRSEHLAAMGRMTATLAHEIKNPLAIIRGSARRLGKLDTEARTLADSVVEEVDRLSGTVNRYLQFARGGTADATARGDAAATLAATLDLLDGEFRSRPARLERGGPFERAVVRLDDASLKQIWLNVLQNALEAVPPDGRVQVTCEQVPRKVRIRIADDGPGIPSAVLPRLGEPFFTTRAQGTGLGLYLSRQLVQAGGGTLEITSPATGGALVAIELPLA